MGSRATTCALTRTAIRRGETVLLVHSRPYLPQTEKHKAMFPVSLNPYDDVRAHTYDLAINVGRYVHTTEQLRATLNRRQEAERLLQADPDIAEDNDPDDTQEDERNMMDRAFHRLDFTAVLGTYDDYGWLELPDGETYRSGQLRERDLSQPEHRTHQDERLPPAHYSS